MTLYNETIYFISYPNHCLTDTSVTSNVMKCKCNVKKKLSNEMRVLFDVSCSSKRSIDHRFGYGQ